MNIGSKIPKKSKHIEIYPFNKKEYIIKEAFYGHQININKKTLDVLNLVDGERSITDIKQLLNNNAEVNEKIIHNLLFNKLGKYGIIENENLDIEKRTKPNYLKFSYTIIKKEWIKPIAYFIAPLFSKSIFYPILLINLSIVFSILFLNFNSLITILDELSFYQWLIYIIFSGIILFSHEFGHIISCFKHGATFGDIGFGFYLFTPVMFADVSDIWRLKSNKRIIVNLSGLYVELILGSIFSILFLITTNSQFLIISAIVSLSIFTNLNPFLRYDGYWILSDITNVPNLRAESNKRIMLLFKNISIYKKYNLKDFLLVLYGLTSNIIIAIVLITIITKDPYGLVYFPENLYNYIKQLLFSNYAFIFSDIYKFILPFLFYYVVLRFLITLLKKLVHKKNNI